MSCMDLGGTDKVGKSFDDVRASAKVVGVAEDGRYRRTEGKIVKTSHSMETGKRIYCIELGDEMIWADEDRIEILLP